MDPDNVIIFYFKIILLFNISGMFEVIVVSAQRKTDRRI